MQPSEQGGALFRPLSLIHRNTAYEVWHAVSPAGRPAVLVGLPTAIAGYKPARDAFAAAVNWALRGPYATIEVLGHDGSGAVPWIAILPEARVVSANAFVQYLVSIEPPTQQMTPQQAAQVAQAAQAVQTAPPGPSGPSAPPAPFAGQQPVAPPQQPVVAAQQQPFVPAQWAGTQQPPAAPPVSSPPVSPPAPQVPHQQPVQQPGPPPLTPHWPTTQDTLPVPPPTVSMPSVSAPPASSPPVSGPPVSMPPAVSMPSASTPPVSMPAVSMPSVSAPPASSPPVSGPPVSMPSASVPPVSMPSVSAPPASGPPASGPPASGPPASGPPASVPPVSMPSVSAPPASGPPAYTPPASGPPAYTPPVSGPPVSMPSASSPPVSGPPVSPHWPVVQTPPVASVSSPPVSAAPAQPVSAAPAQPVSAAPAQPVSAAPAAAEAAPADVWPAVEPGPVAPWAPPPPREPSGWTQVAAPAQQQPAGTVPAAGQDPVAPPAAEPVQAVYVPGNPVARQAPPATSWPSWDEPSPPADDASAAVPPLPQPGEWPSQQRARRGAGRTVAYIAAAVVLLLLIGGGVTWLVLNNDKGTPTVAASSGPASPSPSPSPTEVLPVFNTSAAPVSVLGGTWQPGDQTKTWDFGNWPFAFRTAADVTCEFWVGEPNYKAYNCNRGVNPAHTVMAIVVRRCANQCDEAEQAQLETTTPWKPDVTLTTKDPVTKFGNVDYGDGRQQFTMVHYFGKSAGAPLEWVVIFQGNSPNKDHELVLKAANDIRSQTP